MKVKLLRKWRWCIRCYAFVYYISLSWCNMKNFFRTLEVAFSLKYSFETNFLEAFSSVKLAFESFFSFSIHAKERCPKAIYWQNLDAFYWRHGYRQHDLIGVLPRGYVYHFKKKYEKYSHKYWLPEAVMRRAIETGDAS